MDGQQFSCLNLNQPDQTSRDPVPDLPLCEIPAPCLLRTAVSFREWGRSGADEGEAWTI